MIGIADSMVEIENHQLIATAGAAWIGICEDCTNTYAGMFGYSNITAGTNQIHGSLRKIPTEGYHYYQWTELSSSNTTFNGASNSSFMGSSWQ